MKLIYFHFTDNLVNSSHSLHHHLQSLHAHDITNVQFTSELSSDLANMQAGQHNMVLLIGKQMECDPVVG
jgi:hypothetical protein